MTRLMWNAVGERTFEAGVDRGVLFIAGSDGVPWNGLVSVTESPTGGEVVPYYVDGVKYLNHVGLEDFQATIQAYTYPEEFAECDGTKHVVNGLFVTHQPKKTFGLSYRTKVGNDVDGVDHGYKIHLVYNAVAETSERINTTMGEMLEPFNFSWLVHTKPPVFAGHHPTAHFVVDSREAPLPVLESVEDILYGTDGSPPRLPSAPELLFIFNTFYGDLIDAGTLVEEYFRTIDAGVIPESYISTVDGGVL